MADIFIPKVVDQLTDIALKRIQEGVNLVVGAEDEVRKLSENLKTLEKVLSDADRRRIEHDGVGMWLEKLDDIAYEMDNVLEEWHIKIDKPKEEEAPMQKHALLEKVRLFIQSFCSCLKQVPLRYEFALKIKEINDKLDSTLTEAKKFSFDTKAPTPNPFTEFKNPITIPDVDESRVHGRENDKNTLLQHLLFESLTNDDQIVQDNRFKVISIVGLGGSGKTTLAQSLFNDERVNKHFNLKKWVCVSDPFDEKRIAKHLVEGLGNDVSNLEVGNLFPLMKALFSKKRFLLVLDDVWTEDHSKWERIKLSLNDCALGSVVLVTTRSERVAEAVGTHYLHKLGFLESSYCWLIIKQIALSRISELGRRAEEIGRRIADKCKGLPLAAKTLGGLLLFKYSIPEWQEVLDSNIWQMEKPALDLFPHFYLSYKELSPAMKRCFAFCATFPKDWEIDTDRLIKMWMAQGYLGVGEKMERRGSECVKNLVVRSFFEEQNQEPWYHRRRTHCVKMHDLVHDFAQFLVKGECHAFVEGESNCENVESEGRFLLQERRPWRHVMTTGKAKSICDFLVFDTGNLRTLSLNMCTTPAEAERYEHRIPHLCSRLKSVRALIMDDCHLKELPRDLGALIHLRFLDLSSNWRLNELPEAICDLHYLESLDVTGCKALEHLPKRFGDLGQLRHFLNEDTVGLKQTQRGIESLTSLRVVRKFIPTPGGVPIDIFAKGTHLEELGVEFRKWDNRNSMDVVLLEMVKHMTYLRELTINLYDKEQIPKEIVSKFVSTSLLTSLTLDCCYISSLPALGKLPSLQHLFLWGLRHVEHMGREFYGLSEEDVFSEIQSEDGVLQIVAFPVLKTFSMKKIPQLKTWEDICEDDKIPVMPLLEKLSVEWCTTLKALPHNILEKASRLKELYIDACFKLEIEENWMRRIRTRD